MYSKKTKDYTEIKTGISMALHCPTGRIVDGMCHIYSIGEFIC